LRSSLKKHEKLSSGSNSTTNPTPPGSLTSDDSSYLSARDNSISSHSRVRFSPEILLDMPQTGVSPHTDSTNRQLRRTPSSGQSPSSAVSSSSSSRRQSGKS
jgi:hypothetical protein